MLRQRYAVTEPCNIGNVEQDAGFWAMPHVRGLFFILGGIVLFGLCIRTLGLVVAGPVSMIFASFATNEVRPVEAVIFACVMTAFCILLFKYALGLPIPVVAFI